MKYRQHQVLHSNILQTGETSTITRRSGNEQNSNIYLFTRNGILSRSNLRIYYFKAYDNGTLVRDMVPCYKTENGVNIGGMYDRVNGVFYQSLTSTGFVLEQNQQVYTYGEQKNLMANTFTREGYTFTGWNTSPDGTGTSYTDEQQYQNLIQSAQTINLYAQWTKASPTVRLTLGGYNGSAYTDNTETDQSVYHTISMEGNKTVSRYQYDKNNENIWTEMPEINNGKPIMEDYTLTGNTVTYKISEPMENSYKVRAVFSDETYSEASEPFMIKIINPETITAVTGLTYGSTEDLITVTNTHITMYYAVGIELNSSNYSNVGNTTIPTASGLNAGMHTVYYYIPAEGNYGERHGSVEVEISKAENTIQVTNPGVQYTGATVNLESTISNAQGNVTYAIKTNGTTTTSTLSGSNLTLGELSSLNDNNLSVIVTATAGGNSNYNSGSKDITVTVQKYTRTIEFTSSVPSTMKYNDVANATIQIASGSQTGGTATDITNATFTSGNTSTITATGTNGKVLTAVASSGNSLITATLARTSTVKEAKVTKIITISQASVNLNGIPSGLQYVAKNAENEFTVTSTVAGNWTVTSNNEYVTITQGASATNTTSNVIKYKGITPNSINSTITVAFTPTSANYSTPESQTFTVLTTDCTVSKNVITAYAEDDNQTITLGGTNAGTFTLANTAVSSTYSTNYEDTYIRATIANNTLTIKPKAETTTPIELTIKESNAEKTATVTVTVLNNIFAISLNNQEASTTGTQTIYEKYNKGYFIDSNCENQMTASINGIQKPAKRGYTFGGYYTENNGTGTQYIDENGRITSYVSTTNFTNDGTLYAKWIPLQYTVTYDTAGGTGGPENDTATYDQTYSVSRTYPTKTGYTFYRWADPTGDLTWTNWTGLWRYINGQYGIVNNTLVLTARYNANKYTITLNLKGGTTENPAIIYEKYDTGYYIDSNCENQMLTTENGVEIPTRRGYIFGGYYTEDNGAGLQYIDENGKLTNNASATNFLSAGTLYAKWTPLQYAVIYDVNGGTGGPTNDTATYGERYTVSTNNPTREGYDFYRWYDPTGDNGWTNWSGTWWYINGQFGIENNTLRLTAQWLERYTVIYDANGGTGGPESDIAYYDKIYTVSTTYPTKTGYTFSRWRDPTGDHNWTDWSGRWVFTNGQYGITNKTLTLIAYYTPNTYQVSLNNQEATTAGTEIIYEKYDTGYYTDSDCVNQMTTSTNGIEIPTKTGYIFAGYYTEQNGAGVQYIDENGKLTSNANTTNYTNSGTLYAKWIEKEKNYSITNASTSTTNYYSDLDNAIEEATDGQTIKVCKNVTDTSTVSINKNIQLDLQSYTITRGSETININNSGKTLTITDSSSESNVGTITSSNASTISVTNGTLNVNSGNIVSTNNAGQAINNNGANAVTNIGDSTLEISTTNPTVRGVAYGVNNSSGTVNFNNGILKGKTSSYNGTIPTSNIRQGCEITEGTETISGQTYKTGYLTAQTSNYVQDGLILHLDAINNTGLGDNNHSLTTNTWKDLSVNNNDATFTGLNGTETSGWKSDSIGIDGLNDYATIPDSNTMKPIAQTIEMVFSRSGPGQNSPDRGIIFVRWPGFTIETNRIDANNKYTISYGRNNGYLVSTTQANVNQKYQLTTTHANNISKMYINSVFRGQQTITPNTYSNGQQTQIGMYNSSTYTKGNIYAIRMYNRALTDQERQNNLAIDEERFNLQIPHTTLNLAQNSGTTIAGNTVTTTISGEDYGTLTASSSNTSVATATISGTTLNITGVASGNATITVTSSENPSVTATYAVNVIAKAIITNNPTAVSVIAGKTNANFSVTASGTSNPALKYQWYWATSSTGTGTKIDGATNSTYTLSASNITTSYNGRYYYCEVTQSYSGQTTTVISNRAPLTVATPVTITTQPQNVTVTEGNTATFSVAIPANTVGTISYQWYVDTNSNVNAISGATSSSYTTSTLTTSDNGKKYYCEVTQNFGTPTSGTITVESSEATLTVESNTPTVDPTAGFGEANAAYIDKFGKKVSGYNPSKGSNWRLFYADSNYAYLISDRINNTDYALNNTTIVKGWGTSTISTLGKNLNSKYTGWNTKTGISQYNGNEKAVAALLDTSQWGEYGVDGVTEWAIGAPTLEMFVASYNATHSSAKATALGVSSHQIDCNVDYPSWTGYKVSIDGGTPNTYITRLGNTRDLDKAIYCPSGGYWYLASPSAYDSDHVMSVNLNSSGTLGASYYGNSIGVRPLVSVPISKIGNGITITKNYFTEE